VESVPWSRLGRIKAALTSPIVVDLRNVYEPAQMKQLGMIYHCVGR